MTPWRRATSLLMKRIDVVLKVALFLSQTGFLACHAATYTWKGAISQEWHDPGNWNPVGVPTAGDSVVLNSGGTIQLATDAAVSNMDLSSGTLSGSGTLEVTNVMNWTGGTLTGSGVTLIPLGAELNIAGDNGKELSGHTINNAGTATWTNSAHIRAYGGAVWTNQLTGVLEIQNDQMIHTGGSGNGLRLDNAGIVRKTGGTGTTTFSEVRFNNYGVLNLQSGSLTHASALFNNYGTVQVQAGVLALQSGGSSSGTMVTGLGAMVDFTGGSFTNLAGASFEGAGFARVSGATVLIEATVPAGNITLASGTLDGSGTLVVTNVMNWTGGTLTGSGVTLISLGAELNIAGDNGKELLGHTINNAGTATWTNSAHIRAYGGAVWTNQASGVLEMQNNQMIHTGGSGNGLRLDNAGIVRKTGGTGTTTFSEVQITNTGTFELRSGLVSLDQAYVQTAGSTILRGGNLTVPKGVNIQTGILSGQGTLTGDVKVSGQLNPGDPTGTLRIVGNCTLTTSSSLNVELGGPNPGTQHDQLQVTGLASLNGTLNARLENGYLPGFNSRFQVLAHGSRVGTFATFNSDLLSAGNFLNPEYTATGIDFITLEATPDFVAGSLRRTQGQFGFQLTGIAGQTYIIEANIDLEDPLGWVGISTNTLPGSTLWDFVDSASTNYPSRFYRARFAP